MEACYEVFAAAHVPPLVVLAMFSQVSPLAPPVMRSLAHLWPLLQHLACAALVGFMVFLWYSEYKEKWVSWYIAMGLAVVVTVLYFPVFPVFSAFLLALVVPAVLYVLRRTRHHEPDLADWLRITQKMLVAAGAGCMLAGLLSFLLFNLPYKDKWTDWTAPFRDMVEDGTISWKAAFVAWGMPFGIALELFVFGLLCYLQKKAIQQGNDTLVSNVRMFSLAFSGAAFVLWIGAALGTTGRAEFGRERADMRTDVVVVSFLFFVGLAAWMVYQLGLDLENLREASVRSKVAKRALEFAKGDWAKGAFLFCAAPFLLVYARCPCFNGGSQGTPRMKVLGESVDSLWDTGVVLHAHYVGLVFVAFEVGSKLTVLMLAYTRELLALSNLFVVSLSIFLIGTFLFLLPPTPGAPVYMVTGIAVTASAQRAGCSFFFAVVWAIIVGFGVKMSFAVIAQKCIGEPLADNAKVRSTAQIHTVEMRAIAMILKDERVTREKVSVLIGGPDWPVAVLCGMLRLPLRSILLGTSPVLLQSVIPCVWAGGLLVNATDDATQTLAETFVVVAGVLQVAALLAAGYYTQETIERHYDKLSAPHDDDKEVRDLEEEAERKAKELRDAQRWGGLPPDVQTLLLVSLVFLELSCLLFVGPWAYIFGASCFRSFDITDTVGERLHGSGWLIVNPLGWLAIGLSLVSVAVLVGFHVWAKPPEGGYSCLVAADASQAGTPQRAQFGHAEPP